MRIVVVICAFVISVVAVGQIDQPAVNKKLLTFEEAVKIALQNSYLLNQQRNNLEFSQMQKVASIASIGPTISGNLSATQYNGNSFNSNAGKVINGIRDNLSGSLSANLNLFSGFYRLNSIRQYSSQLEAQYYYVNRTSQDVINTVSTQYLQVMLDVELLKISKENFEALNKQYEQVKTQVELGAKSPVDEYNQGAQTKAAELKFVQAEITLNNDKALLTQTLLIDPFEQFEVESPKWDINAIGNESLKIDELAEQAKQFRGDYLRAVQTEKASRFSMHAAKSLMIPSLYAFGNYGSGYNFQHDVPATVFDEETQTMVPNPDTPRPFSEQFKTNNVYKSYGLQLSIPIFNGLQNKTTSMQQKILYENNRLLTKNLEYQIKNDVQRTVRNYEGSKKAFVISNDQLTAAEMAFQFETERYNLGVTSFVEFANANRVFVQAQTDKAQAEYRLVFQKILLEYAVGTLKSEDFLQN